MKATHIIFAILVICFGVYIFACFKPVWQYDHLEKNASKVITGTELQDWATNLLAHYTNETDVSLSELGTNFPRQLGQLAPKLGPHIFIHIYDDTNQPSYVDLYWGSGFLGAAGFYIGPTNLVWSGNEVHAWQPGVWFYRRG
jgi:hypothetical protein